MPYADPIVRAEAAHERSRRRRERRRSVAGWVDGRGRHGNHTRGAKHPRWNSGRMRGSEGYMLVAVPEGHHLRQAHGYAYEHDLVAEEMIGRHLLTGEVVHHINRIRDDNRLENLAVMTASEHARLHAAERRRVRP
jgi:hypothetical protein